VLACGGKYRWRWRRPRSLASLGGTDRSGQLGAMKADR
jgi:hypothetical protein